MRVLSRVSIATCTLLFFVQGCSDYTVVSPDMTSSETVSDSVSDSDLPQSGKAMVVSDVDAAGNSDVAQVEEQAEQRAEEEEQDWVAIENNHKALMAKLHERAQGEDLQAALQEFTAESEIHPNENEQFPALLTFEVRESAVEDVFKYRDNLLSKGWYLFRLDRSYGFGKRKDTMGILATTDKFEAVEAMGTNGANYGISPPQIVDWLRDLDERYPFQLTEVGFDHVGGRFAGAIEDPEGLAKEMYEFCPDIVDQGVGEVSKLAEGLRKDEPELFLWWD